MLKRVLSFLLCICSIVSLFVLSPAVVSAAENKEDMIFVWGEHRNDTYYRVTKNNAPLRAKASDSGSIVVRLDKGDLVKVTDTVRTWKNTKWLKVSYFGNGKFRTAYLYSGNATKHNVNVNAMRNYATQLYKGCDIYAYWGITLTQAMDLANTASSKSAVEKALLSALKKKLEKSLNKSMDTSDYKTTTYYTYTYTKNGAVKTGKGSYKRTGGCTWYAFNRFLEINGTEVEFYGTGGGGNAKTWDDRINTGYFSKIKGSKLTNKTTNAVAVDNEGSSGYGHVAYIELVIDGYVYYSHGWYKNGKFSSSLKKVSISDFADQFETVLLPNLRCVSAA